MNGSRAERLRDFGPVFSLVMGALAVLVGVGIAGLVWRDAVYGHRLQVDLLGPMPLLGNDVPFLFTGMTVVLVLAFAGSIAWVWLCGSFDRPALGLLAFSLFADVVPGTYQLGLLMIVLIFVERTLRRGDAPFRLTPMVLPLALIVTSYCVTFVIAEKFAPEVPKFFFRATYMAMVVLLPAVLRSRRQLDLLLHYVMVAACIGVTAAIAQTILSYVVGYPVTFHTGAYNVVVTGFGTFPRCTGLMQHPNHQSNALSAVAVLVLWLATQPRRRLTPARRAQYAAIYVYLCIGVLITWSRSGWLALGVTSMLIPFLRWPRFIPGFLAVGGAAAVGAWTSGFAATAYKTVHDFNASSADFRWHIDHIAIQAFLEKPIFGQGVTQIMNYYNPYHLQVHNSYLQAFSELGLFGVATLLLFGCTLAWRMAERLRNARHPADREWMIGLSLAAGITLVQNMFAMFLWIKFLWALLAIMETSVTISRDQDVADEPRDLAFLPVSGANHAG
ncbi:MAG TPA: O-antigen ligase family protein [Planctomycetota bacterium]